MARRMTATRGVGMWQRSSTAAGLFAALLLAPLGGCRLAKPVGAAPGASGNGAGSVGEGAPAAVAAGPADGQTDARSAPARRLPAGVRLHAACGVVSGDTAGARHRAGKTYDVSTFVVAPETGLAELASALERAAPACVVFMNNTSVRLYRDYQRAHRGAKFPPAVVVMASFIEDIRRDLVGATGIAYEVPAVSALVGLRAAITTPITRVGVLHGAYSRDFVERQRKLAAQEHFEIVPVEVRGADPSLKDVRAALRALKNVHHVDALWILNDNELLKDGRFLLDAWTPALDTLGVPVVVGAEPLVNAQASFGTFAVLPDHAALGSRRRT